MSYIGAGHIAGQMIMSTIANRVRCGWGSWLQTIDRIPTYMAEDELPELKHPPIHDPIFVKLLQTVDGIYDGSTPDLSRGALYWGDLAKIESAWFKEKIVQAVKPDGMPHHQRVANTNGLNFWL